jgi:hypothetical protein
MRHLSNTIKIIIFTFILVITNSLFGQQNKRSTDNPKHKGAKEVKRANPRYSKTIILKKEKSKTKETKTKQNLLDFSCISHNPSHIAKDIEGMRKLTKDKGCVFK